MLGENPENGHTSTPVLSALRELIAKGIASRNQEIEAGLFLPLVTRILFAISAARLLEAEGCIRGPGLDVHLRKKGFLRGLSSFFTVLETHRGAGSPGMPPASGGDEPLFEFPDLDVDEHIVRTVINLTNGVDFISELHYSREGEHAATLSPFLARKIRLSGNRVVTEEIARPDSRYGSGLPPGTYIRGIAARALERKLEGKSPVSGGSQKVLDPWCGAGLSLCEAYSSLLAWHESWYDAHLAPLLIGGKDPESRSVQKITPRPVRELATPGFSPLPVIRNSAGKYRLPWQEKARILSESIFGMDDDLQSVMITRLLLLSIVLEDMDCPEESFRPDLIFRILSRNIRHGHAQMTEPGRKPGSSCDTCSLPWNGSEPNHGNVPGPEGDGGFDLVVFQMTGPGIADRQDDREWSAGVRTGIRSGVPEPLCIESGLSLLRKGGVFCGTGTGRWQRYPVSSRFRARLAGFQINEIVKFRARPGENEEKTVTAVITCITNAPATRPFTVMIAGDAEDNDLRDRNPLFLRKIDPKTLGAKPWLLFEANPAPLIDLIRNRGSPLSQAMLGEYFLSEDGGSGRLVISREDAGRITKKDHVIRSFLLPLVLQEDIAPYGPVKTVRYLVVMPDGTTRNLAGKATDPASWFSRHHTTFFDLIGVSSGAPSGNAGCWWEWKEPLPPAFLKGPVLLFSPGTETSLPGWTIAQGGGFPGPGVVALPGRDLSLLGILNSTVFWLYMLGAKGPVKHWFDSRRLQSFPLFIPDPGCSNEMKAYAAIGSLVERRLALSSVSGNILRTRERDRDPSGACALERAIDREVFSLYGMSEDDANVAGYLVSENLRKLPVRRTSLQ